MRVYSITKSERYPLGPIDRLSVRELRNILAEGFDLDDRAHDGTHEDRREQLRILISLKEQGLI